MSRYTPLLTLPIPVTPSEYQYLAHRLDLLSSQLDDIRVYLQQFSPDRFHATSPHEDVPDAATPEDVLDALFSAAEDSIPTELSDDLLVESAKLTCSPDLPMVDCCFATHRGQLSWLRGDHMVTWITRPVERDKTSCENNSYVRMIALLRSDGQASNHFDTSCLLLNEAVNKDTAVNVFPDNTVGLVLSAQNDLIASNRYYNLAQNYTSRGFHEEANTWVHRSRILDAGSFQAVKLRHCLGPYCNHRTRQDNLAPIFVLAIKLDTDLHRSSWSSDFSESSNDGLDDSTPDFDDVSKYANDDFPKDTFSTAKVKNSDYIFEAQCSTIDRDQMVTHDEHYSDAAKKFDSITLLLADCHHNVTADYTHTSHIELLVDFNHKVSANYTHFGSIVPSLKNASGSTLSSLQHDSLLSIAVAAISCFDCCIARDRNSIASCISTQCRLACVKNSIAFCSCLSTQCQMDCVKNSIAYSVNMIDDTASMDCVKNPIAYSVNMIDDTASIIDTQSSNHVDHPESTRMSTAYDCLESNMTLTLLPVFRLYDTCHRGLMFRLFDTCHVLLIPSWEYVDAYYDDSAAANRDAANDVDAYYDDPVDVNCLNVVDHYSVEKPPVYTTRAANEDDNSTVYYDGYDDANAISVSTVIPSWFHEDDTFLDICFISPSLAQAFQATATVLATLSDSISAFTDDPQDLPSVPATLSDSISAFTDDPMDDPTDSPFLTIATSSDHPDYSSAMHHFLHAVRGCLTVSFNDHTFAPILLDHSSVCEECDDTFLVKRGSNMIHSIDHLVGCECLNKLPSVDDSSTISFCSCLGTRDKDLSLRTHSLDCPVESTPYLSHVKHVEIFSDDQSTAALTQPSSDDCLVERDKEHLVACNPFSWILDNHLLHWIDITVAWAKIIWILGNNQTDWIDVLVERDKDRVFSCSIYQLDRLVARDKDLSLVPCDTTSQDVLLWFQLDDVSAGPEDDLSADISYLFPALAHAFNATATLLTEIDDTISTSADEHRAADCKVFPVLDLFDFHFDNCLACDHDLSLVPCDNDFSNHQLDRLVERDKLACLHPPYTLLLLRPMLATMTRYDDFTMLPRNFLAWWIVVLRMHLWYRFWPLLLAPNITSISCLPLTRADSHLFRSPKKTFPDSQDNQVAVPLTKSLDMESQAFALQKDDILQDILSISPSLVQAVETTNDALTRLTATFATVSDTRLPADITTVSATSDAHHPSVSAVCGSLSALCDIHLAHTLGRQDDAFWLDCLVKRDKSYWIAACFVPLPTTLSLFTNAFIARCPFSFLLLDQASHGTTVSISTSSDALEDQHTPMISALRDVSPDLVLTITTDFSPLDDSSDDEASHRIHQLDRLVERDKGLPHDHQDNDCSFLTQDPPSPGCCYDSTTACISIICIFLVIPVDQDKSSILTSNVRYIALKTICLVRETIAMLCAIASTTNCAAHFNKSFPFPIHHEHCYELMGSRYFTTHHAVAAAAVARTISATI
jgi:hypothetical protein